MTARPCILPDPVSRSVACLDPEAVYLSPMGRRCRVCVPRSNAPQQTTALLIYDLLDGSAPGASHFSDGFVLSRANWHLLRKVG